MNLGTGKSMAVAIYNIYIEPSIQHKLNYMFTITDKYRRNNLVWWQVKYV